MYRLRWLNKSVWAIGLVMFATSILAGTPRQESRYSGLDVLLLVDQSGSMGGDDYDTEGSVGRPNDPQDLRFGAPQFAVDWLGNFRAQQAELDNPLDVRVSVLNFGGISNNILNPDDIILQSMGWSELSPLSLEDWQNQRSRYVDPLSAESFIEAAQDQVNQRNLGNTDFIAAFEAGLSDYPFDDDHLQIIILLTDGAPCAPDRFADKSCRSNSERNNHMREVGEIINSRFDVPNQLLYVIGLDAQNNFWDDFGDNWVDIAGPERAQRLENPDDVGLRFNEILTDVAGQLVRTEQSELELGIPLDLPRLQVTQNRLEEDEGQVAFEVPPYQQMMTVTLFKSRSDTNLVLIEPSGERLSTSQAVIVTGQNTAIETWRLRNPIPGRWYIGSSYTEDDQSLADPNADVSIDLFRARFDLDVPRMAVPEYMPVTLELRVVDGNNIPLPRYHDANYVLEAQATITTPDGREFPLPFTPVANNDDTSIFSVQFTPQVEGDYQVSVAFSAGDVKPVSGELRAENDIRVIPTDAEINGFNTEVLEGVSQTYTVSFKSRTDTLADIRINAFSIDMVPVEDECSEAASVERFAADPGEAQIVGKHNNPATLKPCVRLSIADPVTGGTIDVYDNTPYPDTNITVIPVRPLTLALSRPAARVVGVNETAIDLDDVADDISWTPGLLGIPYPEFEPLPVQVTVRVVDRVANDQNVEIAEDLEPGVNKDGFFTLHLFDEENTTDIAQQQNARLQATDNAAVWSASLDPLSPGTYHLKIEAPVTAIGSTDRAFLEGNTQLEVPLIINRNPIAERIRLAYSAGLLGVGVFLLYVGPYLIGYRAFLVPRVLSRINPLQGTLTIERDFGGDNTETIESYNLGEIGRNRHQFKLQEMPLVRPPLISLDVKSQRRQSSVKVNYVIGQVSAENSSRIPDPSTIVLKPGEKAAIGWRDSVGAEYKFALDVTDPGIDG